MPEQLLHIVAEDIPVPAEPPPRFAGQFNLFSGELYAEHTKIWIFGCHG
jgi:hypothetical protein